MVRCRFVSGLCLSAGALIALVGLVQARPLTPEVRELLPSAEPIPLLAPDAGVRADTFSFGYYTEISGEAYAVLGETWTFDHGSSDPLEGWTSVRLGGAGLPFRQISAASWAGRENTVSAPLIAGNGSLWLGAFESEADALCWDDGLGYGNNWCQQVISPAISYSGSGGVNLDLSYFHHGEPGFDRTHLWLIPSSGAPIALNGVDGWASLAGDPGNGNYASYARTITEEELGGAASFRLRFDFVSDGAWSDEDGGYTTDFGALGVDDVTLSGSVIGGPVSFAFESDLDGWAPATCSLEAPEMARAELSQYSIPDLCDCGLDGGVLAFHNGAGGHDSGQHEIASSPIVDRGLLGGPAHTILAEWDMFAELPMANGVFYRARWSYFPYVCPASGELQWSPISGQSTYRSTGADPVCFRDRNVATDWGVPADAQLYRFHFEVYSSCDAFSIPPTLCTGVTNETPLMDNLVVHATPKIFAPTLAFDLGGQFIDGWGQGLLLSSTNAGNADIVYDLHRGNTPSLLGDSLVVKGPTTSATTKWEARLWWRIPREGPGQGANPGYGAWKSAVADGRAIVGPNAEFTFGKMDSAQVGTQIFRDRFISEFREDDDDYVGEATNNNEMIRDGILTPGTQIEYFVTANYICTPTTFSYLPDTSGGNFLEFEILPRMRMVAGQAQMPTLLYVNAGTATDAYFFDHALNQAVMGAAPSDPIPGLPDWDRYDYQSGCSCFNAPFVRTVGGNNGVGLWQLFGYRTVLIGLGNGGTEAMAPEDFSGLSDWLDVMYCNFNSNRQGLIINGDRIAAGSNQGASLLNNRMGTKPVCDGYSEPGCGPSPADESRCVHIEDAAGGSYASTLVPLGGADYQVDGWGNGCPEDFRFSKLSPVMGGVGNRVYVDHDGGGAVTSYSQITKSVTGTGSSNYRSVLDGVSWLHLLDRDPGAACLSDESHVLTAMTHELRAALHWIYDGNVPILGPASTCTLPSDVSSEELAATPFGITAVTPNPIRDVATIRFHLPARGAVELSVFDVGGRRVHTLVDETLDAGAHELAWDGRGSTGVRLPAGVYWATLSTGSARSERRMVYLK
ncbi:MAG: hypothetical protein IPK72_24575 [Candidatus Eisenbacteria bacterium]|nr:hypothetical protein [Candidatus Eisenbacteria bacterium]